MRKIQRAAIEYTRGLLRDVGPWVFDYTCVSRKRAELSLDGRVRLLDPHPQEERILMGISGTKCHCADVVHTLGSSVGWEVGEPRVSNRLFPPEEESGVRMVEQPGSATSCRVAHVTRLRFRRHGRQTKMGWGRNAPAYLICSIVQEKATEAFATLHSDPKVEWKIIVNSLNGSVVQTDTEFPRTTEVRIYLHISWMRMVHSRGMAVVSDDAGRKWFIVDAATRLGANEGYRAFGVSPWPRGSIKLGYVFHDNSRRWLWRSTGYKNRWAPARYDAVLKALEQGACIVPERKTWEDFDSASGEPGWLMHSLPPEGSPLHRDIKALGPIRAGAFAHMKGSIRVDMDELRQLVEVNPSMNNAVVFDGFAWRRLDTVRPGRAVFSASKATSRKVP